MLESFENFSLPIDSSGNTIKRSVTCIDLDTDGNIWISSDYQGLFRYDKKNNKLDSFNERIGNNNSNVTCFRFENEAIWVSRYEDNLYYSKDYSNFEVYKDSEGKEVFKGCVINSCIKGLHNCIYIASSEGLFEINQNSNKVEKLLNGYVRDICFKSDKELWAGTEQGIYIYNIKEHDYIHISTPSADDRYALSDDAVYSIFKDNENGMWIGSYFGGVNYYPQECTYFEKYYPRDDLRYFGKRVREICAGNDNTIWIGTEDKGLFSFNTKSGKLTPFNHPQLYHNIHGLCLDGDYLWVGTFSGGLNRINLKNSQLKHYEKNVGGGGK